MLRLDNFRCKACNNQWESLEERKDLPVCPICGSKDTERQLGATKVFSTIIPDYPGAKKKKAGYVHSHADRPKTPGKIQVGYTGK